MKTTRSTAERIRPILQAMERSIETARRRRLNDGTPQVRPRQAPLNEPDPAGTDLPRRKARPKRSTPMVGRFDESGYRAKVG